MPRHAGPKPFITTGRFLAAVVVMACAVVAVVVVVRQHGTGSGPPAPPPSLATAGDPAPPAPDGPVQRATVVGVADAVTLDVRLPDGSDIVRVRALGIQGPGACYTEESTAFARRVLGTQAVDLVTDGTEDARAVDRFDRRLQRVVLDGGRDYAVLAAEAGIARTYSVGAAPATMPPVRDAEGRARAAGRGLWGPPCRGRE